MKEADWLSILEMILEKDCGDLITHSFLKDLFRLQMPLISNFTNQFDFLEHLRDYDFAYMSLVDKLRTDLLKYHNVYLKNIRGDGYILMPSNEQTDYAMKYINNGIKKAINEGLNILQHTKLDNLTQEQRQKNADSIARASLLKQITKIKEV
jgi:hypothetical protein